VTAVKPHRAHHADGSPSNWQRYLDLLQQRGVPETAQRWYVRRVEEFLDTLKPKALSTLNADQVTDYLRRLSQRPDLADWQRRQTVEALRLLLVDLAQTQAGNGVDWDLWWETSSTAQNTENPPETGPRFARSTQRFPILKDLSRTIRAMQYSIRTEQSYLDWRHRFLHLLRRVRWMDSESRQSTPRPSRHPGIPPPSID
jgi:hypothetical protein